MKTKRTLLKFTSIFKAKVAVKTLYEKTFI